MFRGRSYESGDGVEMYESKKVKRYRSAFTTGQINYLEKQFERCPYIGSATRKEVSNILNIPERAIKIWFQNRRMKEKKEANNKEYNNDRHNNSEFPKDSLYNVHSLQSANDQYSLRSTVEKHVDTANCNYYCDATISNQSRIDSLKKETTDKRKTYKFNSDDSGNIIKPNTERNFISEPANLIKYQLTKDYNSKNIMKYLDLNKKSATKSKVMPKTTLKTGCLRDSMLKIPSTLPRYQDLPEDLSSRNLSNVMLPQSHQGNLHLSSYIPFCNTQDVCFPAGNVIWKPVSVMPAVPPNTIPVAMPERQPNISHNNRQKQCKCNCNCNSKNRSNYDRGNIESEPQYLIAIPYNNNFNILR